MTGTDIQKLRKYLKGAEELSHKIQERETLDCRAVVEFRCIEGSIQNVLGDLENALELVY